MNLDLARRAGMMIPAVLIMSFAALCSSCGTTAASPTPNTNSRSTPTRVKAQPSPRTVAAVSQNLTPTVPALRSPGAATPLADLPPDVSGAFLKTKNASNIRYQISSTVTFTRDGKPVTQPGISAQGEGSGANQHIALSGMMNATGQLATFEIIIVDGETFIKGLAGIPGIDTGAWYHFPQELGNVSKDAPTAKTLLADLDIQDLQRGQFKQNGSATLDNMNCVIWSAQNAQLAQDFSGIANSAEADRELERIDSSEFKLWTCSDGYMHQIQGVVKGHNSQNPSDAAIVELNFHLFDFDAPVKITAPQDAKEFQLPQRPPPTTPTP